MSEIRFTIDNKECVAEKGQTIVEAARAQGVYIPTLCDFPGLKSAGTCRMCTVKVNGKNMAACTTPVEEGMMIENKVPELEDMRKAILEMLFVEGNHLCPTCEKSGNCELQALGYRYTLMVPRFPYLWPVREVNAAMPKIMIDTNRCIQCLRCVRAITTADGKHIFGFVKRGGRNMISADPELVAQMSDEQALKAMDVCPVGSILKREIGFSMPIGKRKYDHKPIGSDIEK
jgi:[NiFe] hydrogenase diaphorase moiety small subunit